MGADRPPRNGFVRAMRKVYNPLGFKKGYNFVLFFLFNGALLAFTLSRLSFLSIWGVFCSSMQNFTNAAAPGECWYYANFPVLQAGITLHLATVLPAALLAVFQFFPIIRYKVIMWHRIAGYAVILLVTLALIGALMIANHSMGGDFAMQSYVGTAAVAVLYSMAMAYINIKRLQIDQHRAWMLRTWFIMGTIITLRLIMFIGITILANWPSQQQYSVMPCGEVYAMYYGALQAQGLNDSYFYRNYPLCNSTMAPNFGNVTLVLGRYGNGAEGTAAAIDQMFGAAGWIALILHLFGVETYLRLTPAESNRLKQVSYERQLERGFKNPGAAGLTAEKLGDSEPFVPKKPAAAQRYGSDSSLRSGSGGNQTGHQPYHGVPQAAEGVQREQVWAGQQK